MIFIFIGIAILIVSFIIALVSLIREQAKNKKTTFETNRKIEAIKSDSRAHLTVNQPSEPSLDLSSRHQNNQTLDSGLKSGGFSSRDDRFPWERFPEEVKPGQDDVSPRSQQLDDGYDKLPQDEQKLGGEIKLGDLIKKRGNY